MLAMTILAAACTFNVPKTETPPAKPSTVTIPESQKPAEPKPAPGIQTKVILEAPFQSQAPFGDWTQPWQDACEEASIIVAEFGLKQKPLSKEKMRDEIQRLVDYQNTNFGTYRSTNLKNTAKVAREVYGMETEMLNDPTIQDLKAKLAAGHFIIAPLAGRLLHNPFFTGAGPVYHMFVIIGFDDNDKVFITHEVGTRHGQAYRYPYQTVMKAIRDLPVPVTQEITEDEILKGAKRVLVTKDVVKNL